MRKLIIGSIVLIIAGSLIFWMLVKKEKQTIPCSQMQEQFAEYPIKFDALAKDGETCGSIRRRIQSNESLMFSADGVAIRISKEDHKKKSGYPKRNDDELCHSQMQWNATTVDLWFRAKQQKESTDIYAKFMFELDGYTINGDIRGIYTESTSKAIPELTPEVFDQTQERIFRFLETYIKV